MTDVDKAIRAAKLTLGAVLDKRRAQTAKDRAGGQIAPSKYLPGVPRQFHADGGDATMTPAQIKAQMELSEDGGQKAQAALDAINSAGRIGNVAGRLSGIPLGGIFGRRVAEEIAAQGYADGGNVSDARATFLAGNHPEVPDVLYHGTTPKIARKGWTDEIDHEQTQRNIDTHDFREFKPSEYGNYGPGIYLTDHPETANEYAMGIRAGQKEPQPHGQVMKLHVGMKQPFTDRVLRNQAWKDYIKGALTKYYLPHGEDRSARDAILRALDNDTLTVRSLFLTDTPEGTMVNQQGQHEIHDTIRRSGFDGIIAHRPDGSREFVAFKPEQVKSAVGNRGTFDPTNPDMTYADGGRTGYTDGGRENGDGIQAAEAVAKMLRDGRASEITNDHLSAADPQHLWKLYETGKTGMDLPMDHASRMERAKAMGFGGDPKYHGTGADFQNFHNSKRGNYFSDRPEIADIYAEASGKGNQSARNQLANADANIIPALLREPTLEVSDQGVGGGGYSADNLAKHFPEVERSPLGSYARRLDDAAKQKGYSTVKIANMDDLGGMQDQWRPVDPTNIRSRFARFDPRLAHLSHLSAATGGRIGYTDGGVADDDGQPIDLGAAREQKQVRGFYKGLMGDIASAASERMDAHQKAIDAGVFDGYEVGDTLQGSAHPMRITGRFVRPWKPSTTVLSHFDRMGAKPTIIEHNGKQYIPMLRYQTGVEGVDGFQEGDAYLDGVKAAGYRKMGGLRAVKADGGSVDDEDEGIDAYHGSPHDFDAFDIAHLGTGEGAQAYGHGLYFAGNEGIAKHYKNVLSTRNKVHPDDEAVQKFLPHSAEIQRRKTALSGTDGLISLDTGSDELDAIGADEEKLHRMMIADTVRRKPHLQYGRMYKVKLNVKPHELLDWDKPLSEQPEVARRLGYADPEEIKRQKDLHYSKFKPRGGNSYEDLFGPLDPEESAAAEALSKMPEGWGNMTGKALHDRLVARTGSKKGAADAMLAAGLKGIRYLDAGSRDISDGDPTHNYVMFHHDPVKVVDKYEYGGRVAKSEGGSMGDDENRPVDLGVTRALRRFNQNGDGPTPEAEGVFNRLAAAQDAADEAHDAARKAGAFDSAQIGDVFKYKPLDTYAPMKVVGHGMVHVSRWGGINPPKYVFNDHFPVAHVEYQDASKERQRFPVELLEDRSRYDFISGKPRIARADGGRLDLYSKAARIIRGMKDQKMDVADILKYATGKGAKKTEIAHVDVPPGKATPSQVAEHIEFMQPQIGVHKREMFYRYKDPEQYERQINYLERQGRHDEAEELTREFEAFEGYGGKDAPIYAKYQLPGGENYREHVLTLDSHPDDQTYMAKMHWGRLANPLAHIRMSTRMIGNKKILHIEEMQSDWNNDARKSGFRTGREKQEYDDYVAKMREDAINGIDQNASPMIRDALRQKYSAMDPYMLALKMGRQPEHASLANSAFMGSKLPPRAPYINPEKDDVYEMAMKHVLMEAAKGGYDGIAFTPDEEQELRWPGHTFKGIYNKRLPGIAQRLVQPHDLDTDTDDMTHLNGWAVPMIPLSDKARDSITQNGFSSFRRGGYVTHVRRAR